MCFGNIKNSAYILAPPLPLITVSVLSTFHILNYITNNPSLAQWWSAGGRAVAECLTSYRKSQRSPSQAWPSAPQPSGGGGVMAGHEVQLSGAAGSDGCS